MFGSSRPLTLLSCCPLLRLKRPGTFWRLSIISPSRGGGRSEEHTSELQSLMRISYAVFCLKKKKTHKHTNRLMQTRTRSKYTSKKKTYTLHAIKKDNT